jgi:hypothetical protein
MKDTGSVSRAPSRRGADIIGDSGARTCRDYRCDDISHPPVLWCGPVIAALPALGNDVLVPFLDGGVSPRHSAHAYRARIRLCLRLWKVAATRIHERVFMFWRAMQVKEPRSSEKYY